MKFCAIFIKTLHNEKFNEPSETDWSLTKAQRRHLSIVFTDFIPLHDGDTVYHHSLSDSSGIWRPVSGKH